MTRIGFTGSRAGMTGAQQQAFVRLLDSLGASELLHGACIGADADAARLASIAGIRCVAYPGRSAHDAADGPRPDRDQASMDLAHETRAELTHFARNRAIVEASDIVIATPSYPGPITRETKGGTAYTYWQAVKARKRIIVIWPDGSTTEEWPV